MRLPSPHPAACRAPAYRFAMLVVPAGIAVLLGLVAGGGLAPYARPSAALVALTALTLLCEHVVIKLPDDHDDGAVTASGLFGFALLLTFGPGPAAVTWAAAVLITDLARRRPLVKAAFNLAQYALSMAAAGVVLGALSDLGARSPVALSAADLPAVALAGATLWAVNRLLASTVTALATGTSLRAAADLESTTALAVDAMLLAFAPVVVLVTEEALGLLPLIGIPFAALHLSAREAQRREHDSLHDTLTGLPNRTRFTRAVDRALTETREGGAPPTVLMLGVDGFTEVTDALGQAAADEVLRHVARCVRAAAEDGDLVARLGSEEFAVMRRGPHGGAAMRALADAIRTALEEPVLVAGVLVTVRASAGLACDAGGGGHDVIRRAGVALRAAKAEGGVAWHDPAHDPDRPARLKRMTELRQGIPRGELVVHYQPQLSLVTGRVDGAEALVRWQHPTEGLLPPAAFIELAEGSDLMEPLTVCVLEAALDEAAGWRREGAEVCVAVNLAAQTLLDQRLAARVRAMLVARGLPGAALRLEITERTLMRDVSRAAAVLDELGALGVRVSVDDFGTGYSSLALLRRLAVDEIKVDRTFVGDMTESHNAAAIVRSTVGLGQALGLQVVAEGVETVEVLEQLSALGCHSAQGYLISRPLPAPDFRDWLRLHRADEPPRDDQARACLEAA